MNRWTLWLGLGLPLLLPAVPARANECYFLLVFGSQRTPTQPRFTHSFATFVRATGAGPGPEQYDLEFKTISWMPQSLDIRVFRALPEAGTNLDLYTTLDWAFAEKQRVSLWGPFQIRKELYDRACGQIAHLQSGEVRYKAVDSGCRASRTSNCIHAVSDLAPKTLRLRVLSPGWGEVASYLITLGLRSWMVDTEQTYDWVCTRLGLDNYPIIHRDIDRGFPWRRWRFRSAPSGPR